MTKLQIKRGLNAGRTFIPSPGELLWTTDTNRLYVGDGSLVGGIEVVPTNLSAFSNGPGYLTTTTGDARYSLTGHTHSLLNILDRQTQ